MMPMMMGMNIDITHRGKIFHIQTEDSGVSHPVIITHIFSAGNILITKRQDYSDLIQRGEVNEAEVRSRMRAQHVQVIRALETGQYDREMLTHSRIKHSNIPLARSQKKRSSVSQTSSDSKSSYAEGSSSKQKKSLQSQSLFELLNSSSPAQSSTDSTHKNKWFGWCSLYEPFNQPLSFEQINVFTLRGEIGEIPQRERLDESIHEESKK